MLPRVVSPFSHISEIASKGRIGSSSPAILLSFETRVCYRVLALDR